MDGIVLLGPETARQRKGKPRQNPQSGVGAPDTVRLVAQPRILLVEDEPSIAEPFARLLAREGFDAQVAGTVAARARAVRARTSRTSCSST